jgi:hypothetical protein
MAIWEKRELRNIMELAFESYSKYSTKKKKHKRRAKLSMLKKKPETSSKQSTRENSGKIEIAKRSPRDKKKILSVA